MSIKEAFLAKVGFMEVVSMMSVLKDVSNRSEEDKTLVLMLMEATMSMIKGELGGDEGKVVPDDSGPYPPRKDIKEPKIGCHSLDERVTRLEKLTAG